MRRWSSSWYADAIKYCREHSIYKKATEKIHFEFGDDIPEGPERLMTDMIGEPIFLCRFPAEMEAFCINFQHSFTLFFVCSSAHNFKNYFREKIPPRSHPSIIVLNSVTEFIFPYDINEIWPAVQRMER
jgi:hypothetical protein